MPKRFTDTEKWKKPFLRALDAPYKLLWFYILDDCDMAGIWQVDFEVARIRTGQQVDYDAALRLFGDRVVVIDRFKWHIPDFIVFQYGKLSETNRMHLSVIQILKKYNLYLSPLNAPNNGAKDKEKDKVKDKDKDEEPDLEVFGDWIGWGKLIVDGFDHHWEAMKGRKVQQLEMDTFLSVATRNNWTMDSQQAFRIALKGFDYMKFNQNGNGQKEPTATVYKPGRKLGEGE